MEEIVIETLRKNDSKDAYIRIIVTRGVGPMGVDPRNCKKPTIIVIAEPREPIFKKEGIEAMVSSIRRTPIWALDPRIKSLNYLNNVLAKIEALSYGVEEAIMPNEHGYVAEASTENIFIVKNNKIITPPVNAGILKGITRDTVIDIAKELGYEVVERNITVHELFNADEVFVTGTAAEIVPIIKINGRIIGNGSLGPVTRKIMEKYREVCIDPKYGTPIYG